MVPRAMGVVQGSRIRNRTSHLKRNCWRSSSARMWPKTTTRRIETKVKMKVLTREVRKAWSWMIATKFCRPTISKLGIADGDVAEAEDEGHDEGEADEEARCRGSPAAAAPARGPLPIAAALCPSWLGPFSRLLLEEIEVLAADGKNRRFSPSRVQRPR